MNRVLEHPVKEFVRIFGVLAGIYVWFSLYVELKSGPIPSKEIYIYVLSNGMLGLLLMLPWRMIRETWAWWFLYVLFCAVFLEAMSFWIMARMWAAMHGAKGSSSLLILLVIIIAQLVVIWTIRPKKEVQIES